MSMADTDHLGALYACQHARWWSAKICPSRATVFDLKHSRWVCVEHAPTDHHEHTWVRRGRDLHEYLICTNCGEEYRHD